MARNETSGGCSCRVPVDEVLAVLGMPGASIARDGALWRGAVAELDWQGRWSLTVGEATAVVAAFQSEADAMSAGRSAEEAAREAELAAEAARDREAFTAAYEGAGGRMGGATAYERGVRAVRARRGGARPLVERLLGVGAA